MKKGLTTEKSFALWIIGLFIGFVWATFFKNAPFDAFAYALTGGLTAIYVPRFLPPIISALLFLT